MGHDVLVASTEAAASAQRTSQRTNDHVDLGRVDVLRLSNAAACPTQDTEGPGLIENNAELVLLFEFNLCNESKRQRPVRAILARVPVLTMRGRSIEAPVVSDSPSATRKRLVNFFCFF